jgi:hypothetical protein
MTEKEKKFLSDISNSIELIESFTKDLKSFADYQKDLKTKGAVERHLGTRDRAPLRKPSHVPYIGTLAFMRQGI